MITKTQIMGILNVTPDSFFDGGCYSTLDSAIDHAMGMLGEGADIIDMGGESTRPGAKTISVDEECSRVIPVIEALRERSDITLSIDTSKPEVMQAAVAAGAGFINDVCALQQTGALEVARRCQVPVCLMHMQGEPRTMQQQPLYQDVVQEVYDFLEQRLQACIEVGIDRQLLFIDPGFGFGKTVKHNLQLVKYLDKFTELAPVLLGVSRKSTIGTLTNAPVTERLAGSLALTALAVSKGAAIIRTHDVRATKQAILVTEAVLKDALNESGTEDSNYE